MSNGDKSTNKKQEAKPLDVIWAGLQTPCQKLLFVTAAPSW